MLRSSILLSLLFSSVALSQSVDVASPDSRLKISLDTSRPTPTYSVTYKDKPLLPSSPLGLYLKDTPLSNLQLIRHAESSHDETYAVPFGKTSSARDHYNQSTILLGEKDEPHRHVEITLRAYDDGVAFRYTLPAQPNLKEVTLVSEDTTFTFPDGATAWVLPLPEPAGHYEYLYQRANVATLKPNQLIGLPLLVELPDDGPAVAITEANVTDYPGMALLAPDARPTNLLRAMLTPLPGETSAKARFNLPHSTPWRVIMVADNAGKLIESNLVSNLSDPSELKDTSWIRPGKVAFLWWNGFLVGHNARRGAVDTATFCAYVDAAAEFGFPYASIDGLDIAWYGDKLPGDGSHDITVPAPGLDIQKVLARAKEKGVRIRLWLPSVAVRKYLDKALPVYERWGIEGLMIDFVHRDDQEAGNWIREVVRKCAEHHLTVSFHNVPKPTGLSRTFPNLLTYEAVRNQEWNKWDATGVTPAHNLTVPFTRMLAGPLDYHSGCFRSVLKRDYVPRDVAPEVMGTRAHQLAMYVVYEDPLPMAVDYPSSYQHAKEATELLASLPTTWDQTRFIGGKVAEYIVLARRKGETWYVGAMSAGARDVKVPLSFLPDGKAYAATVYADEPANGPNAMTRTTTDVTSASTLSLSLGDAGGAVVVIKAR